MATRQMVAPHQVLNFAMRQRGISPAKVARAIGLEEKTIQNLLNGSSLGLKRHKGRATIKRVAQYLKLEHAEEEMLVWALWEAIDGDFADAPSSGTGYYAHLGPERRKRHRRHREHALAAS